MIIFQNKYLAVQACLLDAGGDSSLQTVTNGEPLAHLKALKQSQGLKSCVLDAGELARINFIQTKLQNFCKFIFEA